MNEERIIELSDALAKYKGELVHEEKKESNKSRFVSICGY